MLKVSKSLTWSGLLPFIIAITVYAFEITILGISGLSFFLSYSVVIINFLAGTLWGKADHTKESHDALLIIFTNLWALLSWMSLLLHVYYQMNVSALCICLGIYIHLLMVEIKSFNHGEENSILNEYNRLRYQVTSLVVILHILFVLQLIL